MGKKKLEKKDGEIIMEYDFNDTEKKEEKPCPEVEIAEEKKVEVKKKKKFVNKSGLTKEEEIAKRNGKSIERIEEERRLKKEIEAPIDSIIQSLLDSEKTFVENITRKARKSTFSAFYPFPKKISFLTIGKHEAVVLVVRRHWVGLIPKVFLALLVFFFPYLISSSVPAWFENALGSTFFLLGLFIFFTMISVSILLDSFLKWFFEMNVITNERIIDVDFVSIMKPRISETTFDQVQDVTHSPAPPFGLIFDYGHLYIQTAAAKCEFEFNNIPRPRDVQDTILDLREIRRKSIAQGN